MERVREELICAVCLDFLREPKVLQCAHSFCSRCLREMAKAREQQRQRRSPTSARRSLDLECPSCRHVTVLEHGRVDLDLPTNVNLKRLVEIVSDEEKGRTLKILQRRSTVRAQLRGSDKSPQCKTHQQPVDGFCQDCGELVCQTCIRTTGSRRSGGHAGHSLCSLAELEQLLREKAASLRNLIQPACEVTSIADQQMQVLYQDRDKVVANSDSTHKAVAGFFRQLRQSLDQREKAVLNTVQKYTDVKLSTLDLHHQKLQEDHMAITRAVESLEKLLHTNEGHLHPSLLASGGPLEDELELHQNSVLGVCDGLEEAKFAARFLSFSGDDVLLGETLREAGVLNECQRIPDTNILSMQRVVVSEHEDPYLLVPSRFEDLHTAGPREEVRIDGRKKTQRVMRMSDMVEDDDIQYQIPRDFLASPTGDTSMRSLAEALFEQPPASSLKKVKQQPVIQNGKTSPTTIDCWAPGKKSPEPAPRQPPLPPRRSRDKMPVPPPRTSHHHKTPPPLPPKEEEPATDLSDLYDVPRSLMQDGDGANDTYDVPRHLLQGHTVTDDTYDVPRHLLQDHTAADDTYDVPRHLLQDHTAADDMYDVPRLQPQAEDTYDVPRNLLASPLESPSHLGYQKLHELQAGDADDIYAVPRSVSPTEFLAPPRPPKPGANSGSSTPPQQLHTPQGEEFPAGVVPPRGAPPKPKPRTSSIASFNYVNTNVIIPERKDTSPSPSHPPAGRMQSHGAASSSDTRSKPIPTPRPAKRSHTMKETPQSAPPLERSREKFRWNGELRSAETDRRMSTLPPDIKLGENGRSGHREPFAIFSAEQLARPMNDDRVYPCGVCCSPITGLLVVTDVYNHCVRLVDPQTGSAIERIGREGRSGGNFKEPSAVVMDSDEHIFVTELDNPRVQKFTSRGKYLLKFGQKAFWGSQLHDPYGLALSPDGRLFITDWEKGRILIYQKDGRYMSTIGKDHGFLKFPAGLVFDRQGNLLVTDRGKHCVWVMSPEGKPISRIGKLGTGDGELLLPHGIAVLNNNLIAVSESGNHRVSVFAPNGQFVCSFGQKGARPGMFHYPRHMCVDNRGHLVVADEHNQRIQIFAV